MRVGIALLFLACCSMPIAAVANPVLDQTAIGPGGGTCANGTLVMTVTMGEPLVGPALNGDMNAQFGYWWKILTVNAGVGDAALPTAFGLKHPAPNPFLTKTTIVYAIPQGQTVPVFLGIYDLNGRLVKTLVHSTQAAGEYKESWDGQNENGSLANAGVYFVRFSAGTFARNGRVVLIK